MAVNEQCHCDELHVVMMVNSVIMMNAGKQCIMMMNAGYNNEQCCNEQCCYNDAQCIFVMVNIVL